MDMCRTCLDAPANKHISELEKGTKERIKNCFFIMRFCLDIEVTHDSKITTNLCNKCYRKIISFYKFKALSLKNDSYLKSLHLDVPFEDQKLSVYEDENGIKHENFLESDDFGPSLVENSNAEIKKEFDVKNDNSPGDLGADIENEQTIQVVETEKVPLCAIQKETFQVVETENVPLCAIQKVKSESSEDKINKKARVYKKRSRAKKVKSTKEVKQDKERQVCEECGKSVRNIKEHSLRHQPMAERRMLQCKACPKLFATFSGRYTHYKIKHLGVIPKCDICNKVVRSLRVHKLQVHNPAALRFGCVSCERRFVNQFSLDLHMVSHTKDPKFECDLCQKKFRLKHHVVKHIRKIHENEKNYQCDVCAKPFFDKELLKRHSRTHSKERPYKCDECGLALKTKGTLSAHLQTHSDTTEFHCEVCSKSFKRQEYLRVHMVTHTKEKRFECRYCGVRFGRSHHRSRHEYTAHKQYLQDK